MQNISKKSKIAIASSLVLGTVLFSIGCGGDGFCCKDGEPPIPKIADASGNNPANGVYTLSEASGYTLKLNGIKKSVDTDNGQVVKCNWYIADEGKDGKAVHKKLVKKDTCNNVSFDFSTYADHTEKLVCLEVIDNNGLSSTINNGNIADFNSDGDIRKKQGQLEDRKKLDCRKVVISKTPAPSPVQPKISIYNARTNNLATQDRVKEGCPFFVKPDVAFTPDTTCEWTIDGVKVGSDCNGLTGQHKDDLNQHEVCLITNGDVTNKACETFQAVEHEAPTAVLGVFSDNQLHNSVQGNLTAHTQIFLSCKDSKNDCPGNDVGLECKWDASSYDPVNGSCEVDPANRNYIYEHCFTNPAHTGHGPDVTTPNGETALTYQYICGSAAGKCVEVKLTVTDKRYGKTSTPVIKTFKVNPSIR